MSWQNNMSLTAEKFSIKIRFWYAMEYLGANASDSTHHFSPIYIQSIHQQNTGASRLDIEFFHANYPQGVQNKLYKVKVLDRTESFIVAKRVDVVEDVLIIHELSWDWMKQHFVDFRLPDGNIQKVLTDHFIY